MYSNYLKIRLSVAKPPFVILRFDIRYSAVRCSAHLLVPISEFEIKQPAIHRLLQFCLFELLAKEYRTLSFPARIGKMLQVGDALIPLEGAPVI